MYSLYALRKKEEKANYPHKLTDSIIILKCIFTYKVIFTFYSLNVRIIHIALCASVV